MTSTGNCGGHPPQSTIGGIECAPRGGVPPRVQITVGSVALVLRGCLAAKDDETIPTMDHTPISERPGTTIGRYRLMEQIGEGGMGTVFVAEQERPVGRKVALKIVKLGMDTAEVIALPSQQMKINDK